MSKRGRLRPWASRAQLRGYPTYVAQSTPAQPLPGPTPAANATRQGTVPVTTRFTIYYARQPTYFPSGQLGVPLLTVSRLSETHIRLCEIEAASRGDVWLAMQCENWSPNNEARPLLEKLGLSHTSLSVGDVIRDEEGVYWECVDPGWRRIEDDGGEL